LSSKGGKERARPFLLPPFDEGGQGGSISQPDSDWTPRHGGSPCVNRSSQSLRRGESIAIADAEADEVIRVEGMSGLLPGARHVAGGRGRGEAMRAMAGHAAQRSLALGVTTPPG